MKGFRRCIMVVAILGLLTTAVASCGGGGGGGGGGAAGITISGVVSDPTGATKVPVAGVAVELRKATDNSVLGSTTSAADGSYSFSNVPASTDVYIHTSYAGNANIDSEIVNLTSSLPGADLITVPVAVAKGVADAMSGGGSANWTDAYYSGKSWFVMEIEDGSGADVAGVTLTASPSGPTVEYNNGADAYSTTGPTVGSSGAPIAGGFNASAGVYTITLTKSPTTHTVKLPLRLGDISYAKVKPW